MSDSYIRIPDSGVSVGSKVRTQSITVGANDVHTHYMIPVDEAGSAIVSAPGAGTVYWSSATTQAMDATWTSDAIALTRYSAYSVQVVWTGTGSPVGSMVVQASNDGTNYVDLWLSDVDVVGASYALWDVLGAYRYVRVKYTRTSGGTGDTASGTVYYKG